MELPPLGPDGTLPTVHETSDLWLSDFEDDDLVYFRKDIGFAINIKNQTLLIFDLINGDWYDEKLSLNDLRRAEEIIGTPNEHYTDSRSAGVGAIGNAVGVAIANAVEKSIAKRRTGIVLHLRSLERPSITINITDDNERRTLMEALRQVISDNYMPVPYRIIPENICSAYTPVTDEEMEEAAAEKQRMQVRAMRTKFGLGGYVGILVFALISILPLHLMLRAYSLKAHGYAVKFYLFDACIYFAIFAVVGWVGLYIIKRVQFWIWEARQGNEDGQPQAAR